MVRLRRLDPAGLRDYLSELSPRFFVLRVRSETVDLRWAAPSWAFEEVLRLAARIAALLPILVRVLPERAARPLRRFAFAPDGRSTLALIDEFFSERHRDLLKLPPGEPLVAIETTSLTLAIEQVALGVRA